MVGFRLFRGVKCVVLAVLTLCLLAGASLGDEGVRATHVVIDLAVPILERPDGTYVVEDGEIYGEDVCGIVVYGNQISVRPAEGEFAGGWFEVLDPDGGSGLGYIERKGVEPIAAYERFEPKSYLVAAETADLLLQPGKTGERYKLSEYGFSLIRGEVVPAYGKCAVNGTDWLLLGFSTSIEEMDTSGGIGMRYAWVKAGDLIEFSSYVPDYSKNDPAWMPTRIRNTRLPRYEDGEYKVAGPFAELGAGVLSKMRGSGFWIDPQAIIIKYITADDMCDLYADTGAYVPDFVTTDVFFHVYHLLFSRMLQSVEREYLTPTLYKGLGDALATLESLRPSMKGELKKPYETAYDMLTVPLALLAEEGGSGDVTLSERGRVEVVRIIEAQKREESTITGLTEDYTQYRPRGHYDGVPELERYFRAISFLGNAGLTLSLEGNIIVDNVRAASLVAHALDSAGKTWDAYEAPIDFLVGASDDGSVGIYRKAVRDNTASGDIASSLLDDEIIGRIVADVQKAVGNPRIRDRQTGIISKEEEERTRAAEFRISGKRFTFDAYVMNQLTSPRVGSDSDPRNLPQGTDVMTALGSKAAREISDSNNDILHYKENMKRLVAETAPYIRGNNTSYSSWLSVLLAGFSDSGSRQFFYNSGDWQWKKLSTASASWAELKHDTVLYAKQGGAEMGGGGWAAGHFAPPTPRGYVEPDPQTYAALKGASDSVIACLDGMLGDWEEIDEHRERFALFRDLCLSADVIATKEVRDERLTLDEYDGIKRIAKAFSEGLLLPYGSYYEDMDNLKMALVTDVATDFVSGVALHAATGTPRRMLVFVNDRAGGPRLTRGYVYSYYEFPRELGEGRMTDAEWREMVYDPEQAETLLKLHPLWYDKILQP